MYGSDVDWNSSSTTTWSHDEPRSRTRHSPSPWRRRRSSLTNSAGTFSRVLKSSSSLHPFAANPRSRSATMRGWENRLL